MIVIDIYLEPNHFESLEHELTDLLKTNLIFKNIILKIKIGYRRFQESTDANDENVIINSSLINKFAEYKRSLGSDSSKVCVYVINRRGLSLLNRKNIFGISRPESGFAIVFTKELYKASGDNKIFISRLAKVITHEIGHIFGLSHCENISCVMHHHTSVEDIDIVGNSFCDKCRTILHKNMIAHAAI